MAQWLVALVLLHTVLWHPTAATVQLTEINTVVASQPGFNALASRYSGKWIDVSLSRQRLTAYVGTSAVYSTLISSGLKYYPTPTGHFQVLYKLQAQRMTGPGYDLPGVPWVMYFTYGGHAIHGTYWHKNFGRPMSHGCLNLPTPVASWLYVWAGVGTPVYVHA